MIITTLQPIRLGPAGTVYCSDPKPFSIPIETNSGHPLEGYKAYTTGKPRAGFEVEKIVQEPLTQQISLDDSGNKSTFMLPGVLGIIITDSQGHDVSSKFIVVGKANKDFTARCTK